MHEASHERCMVIQIGAGRMTVGQTNGWSDLAWSLCIEASTQNRRMLYDEADIRKEFCNTTNMLSSKLRARSSHRDGYLHRYYLGLVPQGRANISSYMAIEHHLILSRYTFVRLIVACCIWIAKP